MIPEPSALQKWQYLNMTSTAHGRTLFIDPGKVAILLTASVLVPEEDKRVYF